MIRKLGKSITIVNIIAFFTVFSIGGISIYYAQNIMHNGYKMQEESRNIAFVNELYSHAYRLITAMHHFLIDPDKLYSDEAIEEIEKIGAKTKQYMDEEAKDLSPEKNKELVLLEAIIKDIDGLKGFSGIFEQYTKTGSFDRDKLIELEEYAYHIETTVKDINIIHFDKIARWQNESITNMWKILIFYVIFLFFGGVSVYLGHRQLIKHVVNPVKKLASATLEFSEGSFGKRVTTDTKTEIGQLYQSFNQMADKLQEHSELLSKFNEELEQKVHERTSELQQASEQLQKTQHALIRTEKVAAVGQIAAGVAHEIKNPLNALSLNTQILMREVSGKFGTESEFYETASCIQHEIVRINNILEEFVKFARFPDPQFMQDNINQLIQEVAGMFLHKAENYGINIQLSPQDTIPEFPFDRSQLKMVVINLAQNAFNAMDKGGGTFEIQTLLQDKNVIIKITDTGRGIPEENIEKIFSPFYSTKQGGLGLGLPIVQRIVENHGGSIRCTSVMGEGTAFEIVLPVENT
jgi:signal transduction histidine kinase